MPYVVIFVAQQEDVDTIVFNDWHDNTQYIADCGDGSITFDVEAVIPDWPIQEES